MIKYEDNVSARINGNNLQPLLGASVTVTSLDTGLPASLYSDNGVTPLAQPLITDNTGYFGFYAPDGKYTLTFSGSRFATFTRQITLDDPADNPYASKADLAAGTGSSLVTFTQAGASSVPRSMQDKARDFVTVADGGVDRAGLSDCSAKVNAMLLENKQIRFTPGTYLFTQDMQMQPGNYIIVEAGAKLVFNGARMTSYLQSGITLAVFGEISSVGMTTAPARAGWPSDVGGVGPTTTNERGFIEFGGISSSMQSGFIIYGSGKIHGDWTGTPSLANLWTGDLNFKGIATFYANNVYVSGVEVYGFRGEAVYNYTSVAAKNICFKDLYVHDVNFNALNFNALADLSNSFIEGCVVDGAWQGVELSSGTVRNNTVRNCVSHLIQLGGGVVLRVHSESNSLHVGTSQGVNAINAVGNPANITGKFTSINDRIYGATQNGIYASALSSFEVLGVKVTGYATNVTASTNGYGINIDASVASAIVHKAVFSAAGAGAIDCIRCLSPNPGISNNFTEDAAGNLVLLHQGPINSATTIQREYKAINGIGASGVGFETVYLNGNAGNPPANAASFRFSYILTPVSGGEVGTFKIATYKPTGSSALEDSLWIDNYGQLFPTRNKVQDLGIDGLYFKTIRGQNIVLAPPASVTPANNGDVTFEFTSNTQLKIKAKGSDGVVRSVSLTLA